MNLSNIYTINNNIYTKHIKYNVTKITPLYQIKLKSKILIKIKTIYFFNVLILTNLLKTRIYSTIPKAILKYNK